MISSTLVLILAIVASSAPVAYGRVSVSGLSSGGFMAVQYQVAYSSQTVGAGIVAGGPYYCAQAQLTNALVACMSMPQSINLNAILSYTNAASKSGTIDPVSNLQNHRVWLFSGTLDSVVKPGVMDSLETFYLTYMKQSNLTSVFNVAAQHAFPTKNFGNQCSFLGKPYISNCNLDGAGSLLQFIYGSLVPPETPVANNIMTISQSSFLPFGYTAATLSVASNAYYYLPSGGCTPLYPCKLHIAFHGCSQTTADIGMDYVEDTGFNGWAESNSILVLYPQAVKSYFNPSNANGCWDWWGYTTSSYSLKSGPQLVMINKMVQALEAKYTIVD